jgi:hypothetical protein
MAPKVTAQIDFGMKTAVQDDRAVPAGIARNKQNPPFSPKFETVDDYAFATLCFTTVMGLVAFIAAMFTTMLPLPDTWRYFCWRSVWLPLPYPQSVSFCFSKGTERYNERIRITK